MFLGILNDSLVLLLCVSRYGAQLPRYASFRNSTLVKKYLFISVFLAEKYCIYEFLKGMPFLRPWLLTHSLFNSLTLKTLIFDTLTNYTNDFLIHWQKRHMTYYRVADSVHNLGCANKDLWALCAPIFIIVVYCRTATSFFFGRKE